MTDTRALLQQALSALIMEATSPALPTTQAAITSLSEALAAPDAEPVAHMYPSDLEKFETNETYAYAYSVAVGNPDERSVPLYAAPPTPATFAQGYAEGFSDACRPAQPAVREPLTFRELQLIDGMIDVQLDHAQRCDIIANRKMAEKQKGWDMERVELLQKLRGITGDGK